MSSALFPNARYVAHIPHGSGDAEYRIIDASSDNNDVLAIIDPNCIFHDLDIDPADIAEAMTAALRAPSIAARAVLALAKIIAEADGLTGGEEPDAEDYDDTESASSRGIEAGWWQASKIAREVFGSDAARNRPAKIADAISLMRMARNILRQCEADKAADYCARALKSAEGAHRNAVARSVRDWPTSASR